MHRLDASDQAAARRTRSAPRPTTSSLAEAVELARASAGCRRRIVVYGIEGGSFAVGAPLTPAVAAAALDVAAAVRGEVAALVPAVRER